MLQGGHRARGPAADRGETRGLRRARAPHEFLNAKFGGNRANMSEQDKHLRQQFVLRVLRPIGHRTVARFRSRRHARQETTVVKTIGRSIAEGHLRPPRAHRRLHERRRRGARRRSRSTSARSNGIRLRAGRATRSSPCSTDLQQRRRKSLNHFDCDVVLLSGPSVAAAGDGRSAGQQTRSRARPRVAAPRVPRRRLVSVQDQGQRPHLRSEDGDRRRRHAVRAGRAQHHEPDDRHRPADAEIDRQIHRPARERRHAAGRKRSVRRATAAAQRRRRRTSATTPQCESASASCRSSAGPPIRSTSCRCRAGAARASAGQVTLRRGAPEDDIGFEEINKFQKSEAQKEEIQIAAAYDANGASLTKMMQLAFDTMGAEKGYWLDTGILAIE